MPEQETVIDESGRRINQQPVNTTISLANPQWLSNGQVIVPMPIIMVLLGVVVGIWLCKSNKV